MKKYLILVFLLAGFFVLAPKKAMAIDPYQFEMIPSSYAATQITISTAMAGPGRKICITDLTVTGNGVVNTVVTMTDGATTTYSVSVATGATLVAHWDPAIPWCTTGYSAVVIAVTGPSAYKINYSGYFKQW